ncbi:MAG: hypothetical protein ACTH8E_12380 [Brochothrix thermosphacta]|uniref:hypothetical protein n=1 Tax=Brochothrix thermosphacta TaxID=2756 RepID=UPI003F9050F6
MNKKELRDKFELMENIGADNFHFSLEEVLGKTDYTVVQSFYIGVKPAHEVLSELESFLEEQGYKDVIEKLEEIQLEASGDE